jgi:hypothetical protein
LSFSSGFAPLATIHAYDAVARVRRRLGEAFAAATVSGVVGVAFAIAGRQSGLTTMALSWLAVQLLAAEWSALRLRSIVEVSVGHPVESAPVVG